MYWLDMWILTMFCTFVACIQQNYGLTRDDAQISADFL